MASPILSPGAYPRASLLAFALVFLCLTAGAHAAPLPEAPSISSSQQFTVITQRPRPVFTATDWSISAALMATHVGDYLSTEACIHGVRCREVVLPQALVHRNGLFAAYEFGTASLETLAQWELSKHGHRRLLRAAQLINVGMTARTVADNYQLCWRTPHHEVTRFRTGVR